MGKYFSDVVDKAIEDLYYCCNNDKAKAAADALLSAAKDGDGDACYFLSRCFSGPCYSWEYHPFEENEAAAYAMLHQAISLGSAAAVLGALRMDLLTPEFKEIMPFDSIKEAWDVIYEKAENGCAFCQYMIGNTYYYLDIIEIEDHKESDFANKGAWNAWKQQQIKQCLPWFEKAFEGGMGFAGRNMYNLYYDGEEGVMAADKSKAEAIARRGAELGYPDWQERYAGFLLNREGRAQEALDLYTAAAKQGQLSSWYYIGKTHQEGKLVAKDCVKAMRCYELGLQDPGQIGCANKAGELFFQGKDGISQDYARAVQLFERAHSLKNTWGNDMLGLCYLFGFGCQRDPVRARTLFEEAKYSSDRKNYGLGIIYADGLGVPEDIAKGVAFFQKAGNYPPAQEALLRFKKSMFGKWVRR